MPQLLKRIESFRERTSWLAQLAGTRPAAAACLVKAKLDRQALLHARYEKHAFSFRGCDMSALKEVLVDAEYAFLKPLLGPAPVVADIGAHIGLFSLWLLNEAPGARIVSVEASPGTYAVLERNAGDARSNGAHWQTIHAAAHRDAGPVRMATDLRETMSHRVSADGGTAVPGLPLDAVTAACGGAVDIMKIDIEGAEEAFLTARPDALDAVRTLVIELHPLLCDTDRVRILLAEKYSSIEEIQGRASSKPLLLCR